jgi:hypothetical protein
MSLCTRNRWGTGSGTSSSYTPKTNESRNNEMEDKFKKMMADRAKQDNIWTAPILQEVSNPAKKELK